MLNIATTDSLIMLKSKLRFRKLLIKRDYLSAYSKNKDARTFWIQKLAVPLVSEYLEITNADNNTFYGSKVPLSSKCLKTDNSWIIKQFAKIDHLKY